MIVKICKCCNKAKHHFAKGLCEKCYYKKYREMNKGKIKIRDREYYIKNRKRILFRNKQYREKHKDEIKKLQKKWYQNNREKILAKVREWRNKNTDRKRELDKLYWQRMDVKIRDNFRKRFRRYGRTFAKNAIVIRNLANHGCMGCGLEDDGKVFNVHHIIPFALIRSNELWNLEYLCKACHIKREKYFRDLAKRLGIIIPTLKVLRYTR